MEQCRVRCRTLLLELKVLSLEGMTNLRWEKLKAKKPTLGDPVAESAWDLNGAGEFKPSKTA